MKKVCVTQVRSSAGKNKRVKRTLQALGLGRINKSSVLPVNQSVKGMVNSVFSIVKVTEVK